MNSSWFVKNNIISRISNGPNKRTYTNANKNFSFFYLYPIKPIAKQISHTSYGRDIKGKMNQSPNMTCEWTSNEQVIDRLIILAEHIFFTPIPTSPNQVIFSKQHFSTKKPHDFYLFWEELFNFHMNLIRYRLFCV